ncbi:hypothetical protein C8Q74DRAFT_632386 [Fomes fomentarius]|nr:hypothetical protein C8Q74DRAFT_632386 [Fomes fomentarius]
MKSEHPINWLRGNCRSLLSPPFSFTIWPLLLSWLDFMLHALAQPPSTPILLLFTFHHVGQTAPALKSRTARALSVAMCGRWRFAIKKTEIPRPIVTYPTPFLRKLPSPNQRPRHRSWISARHDEETYK